MKIIKVESSLDRDCEVKTTYTKEKRKEIAEESVNSTVRETAEKYGLSMTTVFRYRDEYLEERPKRKIDHENTLSYLCNEIGYEIDINEMIKWYRRRDVKPVAKRTLQTWANTKREVVKAIIYHYARQTDAKKMEK